MPCLAKGVKEACLVSPCMACCKRGLDLQTGLGKIAHNAFQYRLHLFWNHLTHLVRITGISCAFEPRFACYGVL